MKFKVTEIIRNYIKPEGSDKYAWVEVNKTYRANTWDDLTNLIMSLIDFTDGPVKIKVEKEDPDEQ